MDNLQGKRNYRKSFAKRQKSLSYFLLKYLINLFLTIRHTFIMNIWLALWCNWRQHENRQICPSEIYTKVAFLCFHILLNINLKQKSILHYLWKLFCVFNLVKIITRVTCSKVLIFWSRITSILRLLLVQNAFCEQCIFSP